MLLSTHPCRTCRSHWTPADPHGTGTSLGANRTRNPGIRTQTCFRTCRWFSWSREPHNLLCDKIVGHLLTLKREYVSLSFTGYVIWAFRFLLGFGWYIIYYYSLVNDMLAPARGRRNSHSSSSNGRMIVVNLLQSYTYAWFMRNRYLHFVHVRGPTSVCVAGCGTNNVWAGFNYLLTHFTDCVWVWVCFCLD